MTAFVTTSSEKDGILKFKPVHKGDKFPEFEMFDISESSVIGWGAQNPRGMRDCFDFGRIGNVEVVSWDMMEVVFKRLPPKELAKIATTTSDEVYEVCLALEKVKIGTFSAFEKSFIPSMAGIAATKGIFTSKQEKIVFNLLYKYRKQLPDLYTKYQEHKDCQKQEFKKDEQKR